MSEGVQAPGAKRAGRRYSRFTPAGTRRTRREFRPPQALTRAQQAPLLRFRPLRRRAVMPPDNNRMRTRAHVPARPGGRGEESAPEIYSWR